MGIKLDRITLGHITNLILNYLNEFTGEFSYLRLQCFLVSENGETTKRMDIVNIHLAEAVPENNNPGQ